MVRKRDKARIEQPCQAPFYRDWVFLGALLAGGIFWLTLALMAPVRPLLWRQVVSWPFLALALWHPGWEELLFRGLLQGYCAQYAWGRCSWRGLSGANAATSVLFVLGHWWFHPLPWALAVLLPSLVFGLVRDRYGSVYPAVALHAFYNAGYFWLTGLPA